MALKEITDHKCNYGSKVSFLMKNSMLFKISLVCKSYICELIAAVIGNCVQWNVTTNTHLIDEITQNIRGLIRSEIISKYQLYNLPIN